VSRKHQIKATLQTEFDSLFTLILSVWLSPRSDEFIDVVAFVAVYGAETMQM
jgi:hypothetical protein